MWQLDPSFEFAPELSWQCFFGVTEALPGLCTLSVYSNIPDANEAYYVKWFAEYTVAHLRKAVRNLVCSHQLATDGGKAARAYAGKAILDNKSGKWKDDPKVKIVTVPIGPRQAASAQIFCASVDIVAREQKVQVVTNEGTKLQTVTSPTIVCNNKDGVSSIDPAWKRQFIQLLVLPMDPKTKKLRASPTDIDKAHFFWTAAGTRYAGRVLPHTNLSAYAYYTFWVKEEFAKIPKCRVDFKALWNCPAPPIPRNLICGVLTHSIWVGGFPTPGDAITAYFLDRHHFDAHLSGSFSRSIASFCTTRNKFEGNDLRTANPTLEHDLKRLGSSDLAELTGVYWDPQKGMMPFATNLAGVAIPYSSAPGALSPALEFLKLNGSSGFFLGLTYGANPALWLVKNPLTDRKSVV